MHLLFLALLYRTCLTFLREIINQSLHIIFFDFGAFDLIDPYSQLFPLTCSFLAFLGCLHYLISLRLASPPVIIVFEQHLWVQAPYGGMPAHDLNRSILRWNLLFYQWASQSSFFFFLGLLHLNRALWLAELAQGHLNNNARMPVLPSQHPPSCTWCLCGCVFVISLMIFLVFLGISLLFFLHNIILFICIY